MNIKDAGSTTSNFIRYPKTHPDRSIPQHQQHVRGQFTVNLKFEFFITNLNTEKC